MELEPEQRCGRCKETLPFGAFSPSYRGKTGTWCRACFAAYNRGERGTTSSHQPRQCEQCGDSYTPTHLKGTAAFCSRRCKDRAKNALLAKARLESKPDDRECLHCGLTFGPEVRSDAIFCSKQCGNAAHALQRKLRARTGQDDKPGYLRTTICKRDKWVCGICGKRVNPVLQWPHPMTASLDHIVPVVEGGQSDPANLRLVHLVCNLRRRHLGGGEQLALI